MNKLTLFDSLGEELKGVSFARDKRHREWLYRIWENKLPVAMLIGLNPSTANGTDDDPTIRRVRSLLKYNGYGGLMMCNLFTQITPYPEQLVLDENDLKAADDVLIANAKAAPTIIFCWGNFQKAKLRQSRMVELFPDALCFGKNANGSPKHPLYLPGNTKLVKFVN